VPATPAAVSPRTRGVGQGLHLAHSFDPVAAHHHNSAI